MNIMYFSEGDTECHRGTPKPDEEGNKLKAKFILTQIVLQKIKLELGFTKITQHSANIITTGLQDHLGANYCTSSTQDTGDSQSSGLMIQSAH